MDQGLWGRLEAISKAPLRPNLCVGSRWPILDIPPWRDYSGCPPQSALILNLIEGFEIASK